MFAPRQARVAEGVSANARLEVDVRPTRFAHCALPRDTLSEMCQAPLDSCVRLHDLPKAVIDANATILESDGSDITIALAALSLALAHAGMN